MRRRSTVLSVMWNRLPNTRCGGCSGIRFRMGALDSRKNCRQLLDVLMPGANTHPLRQRYDRRRFFFSGTPYGDFDEVPAEAESGYFNQYELLLNLGWNTMIAGDYDKLYSFVENGGTLFTGRRSSARIRSAISCTTGRILRSGTVAIFPGSAESE